MRSVAIIPARGGSKRLKKKNIIDFHGKPIIFYTINAALKANCFDRIVISTDDEEIFRISSSYHSDVVHRPLELATDQSSVADVCDNFLLSELDKKISYDYLTVLYPTAPMRTSEDIKSVQNKLLKEGYSSGLAVTAFSLPVHQAMILENGRGKKVFPDIFNQRESEVPKYYVDNGSTYSVKVDNFLENKKLITNNVGLHVMSQDRSIDIDTDYQLELARYLYKKNIKT